MWTLLAVDYAFGVASYHHLLVGGDYHYFDLLACPYYEVYIP